MLPSLRGRGDIAMWIVAAAFLWALLGSGPAAAFECANATLPSSLIICSDPELTGLAGEIDVARARLQMDLVFPAGFVARFAPGPSWGSRPQAGQSSSDIELAR